MRRRLVLRRRDGVLAASGRGSRIVSRDPGSQLVAVGGRLVPSDCLSLGVAHDAVSAFPGHPGRGCGPEVR